MRLVGNRFELRPNRIAGHDRTIAEIRGSPRIRDGGKIHPAPENAIGKSGDGVLLHDDSRISAQDRRAHHGKRRIATHADHDSRTEIPSVFSLPRKCPSPLPPCFEAAHSTRHLSCFPQADMRKRKSFLRHQPRFDSLLCADKKNFGILLRRWISRATAIPGNRCPPVPPPAMIARIVPRSGDPNSRPNLDCCDTFNRMPTAASITTNELPP